MTAETVVNPLEVTFTCTVVLVWLIWICSMIPL
jgi:hypothetical protein